MHPALTTALETMQRHPRAVAASVLLGLAGFAVTAFGIAPLVPDAAQLPQRLVVEELSTPELGAQLDALAVHDFELSRGTLTRASDTVEALFRRLGVLDPQAAAFIRADTTARRLLDGHAGKRVLVRTGRNGELLELVARYQADSAELANTHFHRLSLQRNGLQWQARLELAPLVAEPQLASGTIRSSLFAATDEAGIPDAVATQMAEIFATDIDFHRELRKGDTFSVVYEALKADGEPVPWAQGSGRVLSAEFVNGGKAHQAMWFRNPSGRGDYFDFSGNSRRRAFLSSPLEFSRVTSGFAMRFHPLLKHWRAHLGVDYGAPQGTPVRSVGDGVVEFAGRQGGYGNVVQIKHSQERSTVYAHLSAIDVRVGQKVEQGQFIGQVGATGWATGPHLHFEFRVDGVHQDPLEVAKASEPLSVDPQAREYFASLARVARNRLELAHTLAGAHAEAE